jgi:hypothetical protein
VEKQGKTCVSSRRIAQLFNEDLRNVWPANTAFGVDSLFSDSPLAQTDEAETASDPAICAGAGQGVFLPPTGEVPGSHRLPGDARSRKVRSEKTTPPKNRVDIRPDEVHYYLVIGKHSWGSSEPQTLFAPPESSAELPL